MNDTKEDSTWFGVAFLDVSFHRLGEWEVAGLISLHDFPRTLRDDDDMVIFVENSQRTMTYGMF